MGTVGLVPDDAIGNVAARASQSRPRRPDAAELAEAGRPSGDDRFSSLTRLKATQYLGVSKIRGLFEATYFAGLRLAGMPEE